MSDRGMKKWAPYRSLNEHMPIVNESIQQKNLTAKPKISQDKAEDINDILTNYHGENLIVTFFRNHKIQNEENIIKKIVSEERKIILLNNKVIYFEEIIDLKIK